MTIDPKKISQRLGAEHVGQVPDTGGGAFGMARLAEVMKQRLDTRGSQPKGTGVGWILGSKVPMSAETEKLLIALADKLSTSDRRINPIQLAAQLLEETVHKLANDQTQ